MRSFFESKNVRAVAFLWGGFWPVAWLLPRDTLYYIVNSLVVASSFGVVVAYLPSVKKFILRNDLDGAHYLVIGITGMLGLTGVRYIWTWAWRMLGKPDYMVDTLFVAFLIFATFTCACVHLMARGVVEGEIPRENWRWLGIVVALATSIALMLIAGTVADFSGT